MRDCHYAQWNKNIRTILNYKHPFGTDSLNNIKDKVLNIKRTLLAGVYSAVVKHSHFEFSPFYPAEI